MKKFAVHTVSIIAILALAGCLGGPSAKEGVTKSKERSSGFMGLSTADAIKVDTAAAFKGVDEVVIGSFIVGFDVKKTQSNKAGGGLSGGFGGKSTAKSNLSGVDEKTMQALTDKAYADFISKLKAAGYKVGSRDELLASEDFKDVKKYDLPYIDDSETLITSGNAAKYFAPSSFGKSAPVFAGDIPGVSGGFAFGNANMGAATYAEKNGKKVINVAYRIDYVNANGHGDRFSTTSSIQVGQGISVAPEGTRLGIIGGQGGTFSSAMGTISLGQPINSEKEFAKIEGTTSDTERGLEVAANVIGVLGGVGTNSKRSYEFKANPAKYSAAATDVLKDANGALVGKMSSLK